MASFASRYRSGEHEQVWTELSALGDQIRTEPLYTDALTVARETIARAKFNIDLLIARLTDMGYQFGNISIQEDEDDEDQQDVAGSATPTFALPPPNVQERIDELEHLAGPLPLSLRAWYERIGAVNFMGALPQGWSEYDCRLDFGLDPLEVAPIEEALEDAYRQQSAPSGETFIIIAPDYLHKVGVSGDAYLIRLPNTTIDAVLEGEWHHTTFVDYLRVCFRYGGFPGFEKCRKLPLELTSLTLGLLPI